MAVNNEIEQGSPRDRVILAPTLAIYRTIRLFDPSPFVYHHPRQLTTAMAINFSLDAPLSLYCLPLLLLTAYYPHVARVSLSLAIPFAYSDI